MGLIERILYSRKILWLILLAILADSAYIARFYTRDTLIYGTGILIALLGYVAYYSLGHVSVKEGASYTVLASIALITGLAIGLASNPEPGIAETLYVLTLTTSLLIINYTIAKHLA